MTDSKELLYKINNAVSMYPPDRNIRRVQAMVGKLIQIHPR